MQRFLDPSVLASISGLELIAKTVVDGFVSGLHRSPDFGFSQEFAEYRAYSEGDDLRHVDWNVFARTERAYLKRYRGETNTQLTILMDSSASMAYASHVVGKLDYARYLAASICYLSHNQRDAIGLMTFDDEVRQYVPASSRHGQFLRVLHAIESAKPGARTDFRKPFIHCMNFLHRRGILVVISDFYAEAEVVVRTMTPLRAHGDELILFHVMDPQELRPAFKDPAVLIDMETGDELEVTPDYLRAEYPDKVDAHIEALRDEARRAGIDYFLLDTSKPLDAALRDYLLIRQGRA
jgi:uncharacterized protein (DUF58 family)